jgi:hypothetical protein
MAKEELYTTQLQAGLGLVDETLQLLDLWEQGDKAPDLYRKALDSGRFAGVTARRLRNVVSECFAPRYLRGTTEPALLLQRLKEALPGTALRQLLFLYTARANSIFGDFVRKVYWRAYTGGRSSISTEDARVFVLRAIDDGRTSKRWSESTVKRISSYLIGCCTDFGLLAATKSSSRSVTQLRIENVVALFLAYDLHTKGLADNALMAHDDWLLFGLDANDVREELRRLGLQGHMLLQSAGASVRIEWKYKTMEELVDALTEE